MTFTLGLKRAIGSLASIALLAFTAAASQAADAPMGDGGTIKLMVSPAGTMSIPPYIIQKFGLDKKYGFKLEAVPYIDGKSATAALQSKSTDMVVFDWLTSARVSQAGINIVGIAPFLTYVNSVLVPVNSPIKTLEDLKGKRLGVESKTSFDWNMMSAGAKQLYGMDLGKEATIQEAAPPLLRGSMDQGQLDATEMWNSLAADMVASGKYRTLVSIRSITEKMGIPTAPFLFYGMRADYAKDHPANARAFVAAYQDVVDIMKTNDDIWTERGQQMKLSPEGIKVFRDEVRADILKKFTPEMNDALDKTFQIVLKTAGPTVTGFTEMPKGMLSLDYQ